MASGKCSIGELYFCAGSWDSKIDNKCIDLYSIVSYFSLWELGAFCGEAKPKKAIPW